MLVTARTLAFTITVGCGALATVALAQPPSASGGRAAPPPATAPAADRRAPRTPPADIPSLSAAQQEQMAALRRQARQQLAPQLEQLRVKGVELRALWRAEPPSEAAILKKLTEIDALRAAMRPVLIKSRLASLALLTREQRQAWWRPNGPRECARHAHRMHHAPGDELAPHGDGMMPWLDDAVDLGLDADGTFGLDPMPCSPREGGPPASSPR